MVVRRETKAIMLALCAVAMIGFLIPSKWIMRVDSLAIVGPRTVAQDRTVLVPIEASWIAVVQRVSDFGLVSICDGHGKWFYENDTGTLKTISLSKWVGEDCVLSPGQTYRLHAVWRPQFFIWRWRVEANSAPYTVPE